MLMNAAIYITDVNAAVSKDNLVLFKKKTCVTIWLFAIIVMFMLSHKTMLEYVMFIIWPSIRMCQTS